MSESVPIVNEAFLPTASMAGTLVVSVCSVAALAGEGSWDGTLSLIKAIVVSKCNVHCELRGDQKIIERRKGGCEPAQIQTSPLQV